MRQPLARLLEKRMNQPMKPGLKKLIDECEDEYEMEYERENGRRGGRSAPAPVDLEEPEWWRFYVERAIRNDDDGLAEAIRSMLGLTEPLSRDAAAGFVREVIAEAGTPDIGAYEILNVPVPEGCGHLARYEGHADLTRRFSRDCIRLTVYDGVPEHSGRMTAGGWEGLDLREGGPLKRYLTLVVLASIAQNGGGEFPGWDADEFVAFVLCDIVPPRPWLRYEFLSSEHLCDQIVLTIPTAAVTPEQVRALYEQARQALGSQVLPKAVSKERIRLVRFVEEEFGPGPYNWGRVLELWQQHGGNYASPAAIKTAFYQSANPVRVVARVAAEDAEAEGR